MEKLLSRKLILGALAIAGNVGLILGLAVIDRALLTEAQNLVYAALIGINGIAGFGVFKQAELDRNGDVSVSGSS